LQTAQRGKYQKISEKKSSKKVLTEDKKKAKYKETEKRQTE
jgi:hypothetical protein